MRRSGLTANAGIEYRGSRSLPLPNLFATRTDFAHCCVWHGKPEEDFPEWRALSFVTSLTE